MDIENTETRVDRRTFFTYVTFALSGFIGAVLGIPLLGSLILPTLKQRPANWVSAGSVSAFAIGQPQATTINLITKDGWIEHQESKGVWVVRVGENDFNVFSGRCVHLGCAVNWMPDQNEFICPCHGGRYALDGKVLGGPPPRPLDTLEWRIEQGNLMVRYQEFRLGVSSKEVI
ncbi:MAG: ubiquinol-cytochrome c reductase iron-sulfur subunit [Chloroflexota bacterium]